MLHPHNNDYDLASVEVWSKEPFAIGGTRIGRAADQNWLVHWVDESTLAIAPEHEPTAWKPAHVYSRSGNENETQSFVLAPSERESAQWEALEKVIGIEIIHSLGEAIDEVKEQTDLLAADGLDCAPFDGLAAKLSQARQLIVEAKAGAAAFVDANGPPSTNEPCKLTPRGRR
jgi:hypothetical protein